MIFRTHTETVFTKQDEKGEVISRPDRPALIVSSTSWTGIISLTWVKPSSCSKFT